MKKLIISLVIVFAFMASVNAQTGGHTVPSDPRFMPTYNQALLLNEDRFADLDKIQIGDTVYFPGRNGAGVEYWVADYPNYGVHDCIWRLTGKYLAGQLPIVVVDTPVIMEPALPVVPEKNTDWDLWAWIILIGIAVLAIIAYLLNRFRPWNNRQNLDSHPSIDGGLSRNPGEAAQQVAALTGSRVVRSERGRLICDRPVKAEMNFSDGVKKVQLVSGEEYYRITESDGNIRYARRACGNLINGSISQLPEGVTFVPSTEENSSWAPSSTTTSAPVVPVAPEKPANYFDGLAKVLEIAGAMVNAPEKITFGDLVVEFQPAVPAKEEKQDK